MLIAHHVIDILRGKVKRPPFLDLPGVTMQARERAAIMIYNAQKFDFGNLVLELKPDAGAGVYTMPPLTADERQFWIDGLIPLPYMACWYEFTINQSRSGLLVWSHDSAPHWMVERIDYTEGALLFEDIVMILDRDKSRADGDLRINVGGNTQLYEYLKLAAQNGNKGIENVLHHNLGSAAVMAIYFTLMLNSRTTEVRQAPPVSEAVNKQRVRRDRAPLQDHRIVTIVPDSYRDKGEDKGGTHRPPRLHWRRTHLRHYDHNTPTAKWMPAKVYRGVTGWWVAVIPRALVGRADLGEVSHEYRVEADAFNASHTEAAP